MSNHHKHKSIECKKKKVEKTVDKVVHVRMKQFTSYSGNYGTLALDRDDNMSNLQTTNINKVTTQTHGNVPEYIIPK